MRCPECGKELDLLAIGDDHGQKTKEWVCHHKGYTIHITKKFDREMEDPITT